VALLVSIVAFGFVVKLSYELLQGNRGVVSKLEPVAVIGPEETVFDWTKEACAPGDIPDVPAHAFRDDKGAVHLLASSDTTREAVGPTLGQAKHRCRVVMRSAHDPDPSRYEYKEWIFGPYSTDGKTVYALVHDEYHGNEVVGKCPSGVLLECWYNAITLARSDDSGGTFHHIQPPPRHLVASIPYRYVPDAGRIGMFQPSNIVKKGRHYYALASTTRYRLQESGACLMRTDRLDDPRSWRAWDGSDFRVEFANPYQLGDEPGNHVCKPVSPGQIADMTASLTYNTYFGKYLLVGNADLYIPGKRRTVSGFFYSLSDDLLHWSERKLIKEVVLPQTYRCGDPDPVYYPSVLDPESKSRNFETTGRRAYIYFTRLHYKACEGTLDRDLVRVPVEFSK
jgi:hypothetical protein